MVAVIQKKAFKPGRYRGQIFTAERLRQFAEGTNKALAAGVPIPGLKKHAKLAADDKETDQFSATDGAGWLKKLEVEDDGSLTPHFDVSDEIAKGIKDGSIKFTSPEFRDNYQAADGRYSGPLTRHWAFTPLPKAHDQGDLAVAMSEGVYQFAEDDYEGPPEKDGDGDGEAGEGDAAKPPPKNPDMPPKATDSTKLAAVIAGMAQLGVVLPSDFDLADPERALDLLITGINTQCKAKQEAESKEAEPEEPETKESEGAMPFSERDIAALPAPMQTKARKANADAKAAREKAVQFSEERKATAREKSIAALKAMRLPPGLKTKLLDQLGTVQFSESGELPSITIEQAAKAVSESLPPNLQFDDTELSEAEHPEGAAFFDGGNRQPTAEEAEAFARRIHSRDKSKK